jgi:hypothetical protein
MWLLVTEWLLEEQRKVNGITIYELQECEPFDTWDADYFRDATDVSFDIKFAKEIKTYNNGKRVYLNTGTFNYYKMKKECFKFEQKTLFNKEEKVCRIWI